MKIRNDGLEKEILESVVRLSISPVHTITLEFQEHLIDLQNNSNLLLYMREIPKLFSDFRCIEIK